ncbi:hypothetical protein K431DRAFT_217885 [Polychaeton citri CBS 116435]|uniref:Uncharacterized protein n=1 Tax=Polychaeton citri CBS 116435 TaxID=1314669 RepID=A0A9P4QGJ2_9PEZI|nr:hypothetical protein K431DRAFT_217885 [Polychaeton citri CBS 116435]
MDPRLAGPEELYKYINDCLQHLPPTPRIHIRGSHTETRRRNDKKETHTVTDFAFSLSLGMYLGHGNDPEWRRARVATNGESTFRGSWRKTRAPGISQDLEVGGPEERDIQAWVEDYCSSPSKVKIFRVARTVTGMDEKYLKNAIEQAIRRTNYRGDVSVNVAVENRAVDIYSEHWVNKWRNGWQRWIFYLTFFWIFTWPILYFLTKRWAIYTVDWPFSVAWPERGENARRFATISEEAWLRKHDNLIRRMAIDGFEGDASGMPLEGREPAARNGRAPSTGNANVDSAVSFIQGGVGVWNSLQGRGGGDIDGWGGDC